MDWDELHVRAKAALPSDYELQPNRCWIGVLRHDISPDKKLLEEPDFIWMKGHERIKVKKVVDAYHAMCPDVKFDLRYKDVNLGEHTRINTLNDYHDNVTVLRAIVHVTRAPLQRVSAQPKVEPPESNGYFAGPIKRQASGTPKQIKTESDLAGGSPVPSTKAYMSPVLADKENDIRNRSMYIAASLDRPDRLESPRDLEPALSQIRSSQLRKSAAVQRSVPAHRPLLDPLSAPAPPLASSAYASPPTSAISGRGDPYNLGYAEVSISGGSNAYPSQTDVQTHPHGPAPTAPMVPIAQMLPTTSNEIATTVETEIEVKEEMKPEVDTVQPPDSQMSNDFDPDEIFAQNFEPTADSDTATTPSGRCIQNIIDQTSPEILEAGVAQAMETLSSFEGVFAQFASSSKDASAWIQSIDKLRQQGQRKRTVIGVVGNTGAGKSSVINALLDEERLVPTNCMRACTAVVTELSWNDNKDANSRYRAEIEFITPEDWEKDLKFLLKEFLSDTGTVAREAADQNSDAGIAWAKFHAVYPTKTKDKVKDCDVPTLMREIARYGILGKTETIHYRSPGAFYQKLQKYVDSMEKVTGKDKGRKSKKGEKAPIEYWPLIKVVRIYVKSPALSTGAVIVDLPGVQDSNAARAAVAQNYMKQCTGLWIVAPITRAVDDKTAQSLMGDSFKRQLKMDGGLSSITFICSKTDDISVTEAIDSLDLQDEMAALTKQIRSNKKAIVDLTTKISDLEESRSVYNEVLESADKDLDIWEALEDDFDDGNIVYAPRPSRKRKRGKSKDKSRKRPHNNDDTDDESSILILSSSAAENGSEAEKPAPRIRLTGDDIKSKIGELKKSKKTARRERNAVDDQIRQAEEEIVSLKDKNRTIRAQQGAACISGRNEYSRGAIQLDFAAGVKELDQEHAAEEDEENFDPDKELRDYDQVARDLPVFCVSSRAYQKLCGRMREDDSVPGFSTLDETEIPQLQAYCKHLTESGRVRTSRAFLVALQQHLNTFYLWCSNDSSGLKLTDVEKRCEVEHLYMRLRELEKGLEKAVETCINTIKNDIACQICDHYPKLIQDAISAAPDTAQRWGAHKNDGGLVWSTYKAIVRRDGVYQSSTAGLRDFNADLTEPITKQLATRWERTFQQKLPKAFESYTKTTGIILRTFHDKIEKRAQHNGMSLANMQLLANNAIAHERLFDELRKQLMDVVTELQRDANREFTPTIVNTMHTVYEMCAAEYGQGSFARMKAQMSSYIDNQRHHMFAAASEVVRGHLTRMCRTIDDQLAAKADDIFKHMKRDYTQALGGIDTDAEDTKMPKFERELRAEIKGLLLGIDEQFKDISDGNIPPSPGENEGDVTNNVRDEDGTEVDCIDTDTGEEDDNEDESEDDQVVTETEMQDLESNHSREESHEL